MVPSIKFSTFDKEAANKEVQYDFVTESYIDKW